MRQPISARLNLAASTTRHINALSLALIVALASFAVPLDRVAAEQPVDLELVLAVDISRSMDLEEAALVRQGFVDALRHPDVVEAIERGPLGRIAVTYVEWGGDRYQRTRVDWTEISDAKSAETFAEAVNSTTVHLVDWTSISGAIAYGAQAFEDNGYEGARRIVDVSGDGPNNKGSRVNHARDRAVSAGIVINGLPIINDRPQAYGYPPFPDLDLYYEDCVIGGPGAFMVVAEGFTDFARAVLRKLVTEIAGRSPPPPLLLPAVARARPPCNAGEIQLQEFLLHNDWLPPAPYDDF